MRTIHADFNALTESESVRLTTHGSEEDVRKFGVRPGDWVWLSDGELRVGARVAEDPRYRLVALPAWDTMVHLLDEPPVPLQAIEKELSLLFESTEESASEEQRVLQLLAWWENKAPNASQGASVVAARRAYALMALGHKGLALGAAEDALEVDSNNPEAAFIYLNLLINIDPSRSLREAEARMCATGPAAVAVAACVNVLSSHAARLSGEEFLAACRLILEWSGRFENAPGQNMVPGAILALLRFDQGLACLGLGTVQDAHRWFREAQIAYPGEELLGEALGLCSYGQEAKDLAARLNSELVARLWSHPVAA